MPFFLPRGLLRNAMALWEFSFCKILLLHTMFLSVGSLTFSGQNTSTYPLMLRCQMGTCTLRRGLVIPCTPSGPGRCLACSPRVNCFFPLLPSPFQLFKLHLRRNSHLCSFEFYRFWVREGMTLLFISLEIKITEPWGWFCSAVSRMEFGWAAGGQGWFLNWPLDAADWIKPGLFVCLCSKGRSFSFGSFVFSPLPCSFVPRSRECQK